MMAIGTLTPIIAVVVALIVIAAVIVARKRKTQQLKEHSGPQFDRELTDRTSQEFFEQKYRSKPDPWDFASSEYEQNRYSVITSLLNDRRYARAFEPGCSIGRLTAQLADLCIHVDAMDISPTAVTRAREHCKGLSNVVIQCGSLPEDLPSEQYDLIILSEMGYYFTTQQLRLLASELVSRLNSSAVLVACHWLGRSTDHILSGDEVHGILDATEGLRLDYSRRYDGFRVDRWVKP